MVNEINCSELLKRLAFPEPPALLDVRSDLEVAQGILPGAIHIPMEQLADGMLNCPDDQELVIYCRSGIRSYHACRYLVENGFSKVINLQGGIVDWVRTGNSLSQYSALSQPAK